MGIGLFSVLITAELIFFFREERARLIDQQVEVLATSLLATGIFESRFEEMQSQVSKALGTRETVAFLSIYDPALNLRFRNPNAQILFADHIIMPRDKWMTLSYSDHKLRILNLKTQGAGSWIQVGILIDQEFAEWQALTQRAFMIVGLLLLAIAVASYFMSRALLLPLSELAKDLRRFSEDFDNKQESIEIFKKWKLKTKDKDSFSDLVDSLTELRARLSDKLKMNDATLSQMAHEFRTPLSVIRAGAESMMMDAKSDTDKESLQELISEADRLSGIISSFLDWSRIQQVPLETLKLDDVSVKNSIESLISGLELKYPGRLVFICVDDIKVRAYIPHLEQVISNLVSNALKYSPSNSKVDINLNSTQLSVSDRGAGVPERVMQRMGEPFNAGNSGTGLGLAWVKTLCERYGWNFELSSSESGTRINIKFS